MVGSFLSLPPRHRCVSWVCDPARIWGIYARASKTRALLEAAPAMFKGTQHLSEALKGVKQAAARSRLGKKSTLFFATIGELTCMLR